MCICMSRIWPILTCDMASETYISCIGLFCLVLCQKRPIYETFCDKRDLCMRPMNVWQTHDSFVCVTWQKRRTCATKRELYIRRIYERHTYRYVYMSQARISHSKRDVDMGQKETRIDGKRDLHIWQKRPTHMEKETHVYRIDSYIFQPHRWQTRHIHMTKETYTYEKRDPRTSTVTYFNATKQTYTYDKRDPHTSSVTNGKNSSTHTRFDALTPAI